MTGGRSRSRGRRRRRVLVFGESENDTRALAYLLRDLIRDGSVTIEPQRTPPVLVRDARPDGVPDRAARILAILRAASVDSEVVAFVAHEDCDAVEPAHVDLAEKIRQAFGLAGPAVIAATPAWELEAWLMQWPEAFAQYRPKWGSASKYAGRRVGLIVGAKEDLTRTLRVAETKVRDYRESDAPSIAEIVSENGWARAPRATSDSYRQFIGQVDVVLA